MSSDDVEMDEILGGEVADGPCEKAMEVAALRAEVSEGVHQP